MNILKRSLAMLMALCMLIGIVPMDTFAAEVDNTELMMSEPVDEIIETNEIAAQAVDASTFMKVFHLDCGRKYFTVDQVKELIDEIAAVGFSHMELAIGNDGLRLLLDDMSIEANGKTYASDTIKSGIQSGNKNYSHSGEWSEAEMDEIIAYAKYHSVEIIPLVNNPGHMDSILAAMSACGIKGNYKTSTRTVDLENAQAVAFTKALVMKYANYFKSKGCNYFNIGADEYANDYHTSDSTGMGFGALIDNKKYGNFITYVNDLVAQICDLGMTPIAFNDGIYFRENTSFGTFDTRLVVAAWSGGWGGIKPASTTFLQNKGHQLLNTNERWYYVLGRRELQNGQNATYSYEDALANAKSEKVTVMTDRKNATAIGAMQCVWCDEPAVNYETYKENVKLIIKTLAENNSTYFTGPNQTVEPEEPEVPEVPEEITKTDEETGIAVSAPGLTDVTISLVEDEAEIPEIEGAEEVLLYDVTPMVDGEAYTGAATISVPVPESWTRVLGGVLASEHGEAVFGIKGTLENGMFTFRAPHFSGVTVYAAAEPEYDQVIELKVGKTHEFKVEGKDLRDDYTVDSEGIAEVNVSYEKVEGEQSITLGNQITPTNTSGWSSTGVIKSGDNYLVMSSNGSLGVTTEVAKATEFTVTRSGSNTWTIKNGNYYLRYNNSSVSGSTTSYNWRYNNGFCYQETSWFVTSSYYLNYSNGWKTTENVSTDNRAHVYNVEKTDIAPVDESTVNFKALAAGETYVTIDGVVYKIVVKRDEKYANIKIGESKEFADASTEILSGVPNDIADVKLEGGNLSITGKEEGVVMVTTNSTVYTISVSRYQKTVNIKVGETSATITDDSGYYTNVKEIDENIATVVLGGNDFTESTAVYTQANNVKCTSLSSSNVTNLLTDYYVKANDGNYYPMYVSRSNNTYTYRYSVDGGKSFVAYGTQTGYSSNTNVNINLYTKTGEEAVPAKTTIAFTGVSEGTTYAVIGNTRYTINVSRDEKSVVLTVGDSAAFDDISAEILSGVPNDIADVSLENRKLNIRGKAVGITTIITDTTVYTINVVEFDPSTVTPLTVEYWITNIITRTVESTRENPVTSQQISVTASGVATAEGADINAMMPEWTIKKDGDSGEDREVEFWHVRMLDKSKTNTSTNGTEEQTDESQDDETTSGNAVTRVRYYDPADGNGRRWQMLSGTTWMDVNQKNHQIAAYYMEVVDIYKGDEKAELHVNSADWGKLGDNSPASSYADTNKYCSISFQVIYEDGSGNPPTTTVTDLDSKTLIFNYWDGGRGIGTFAFDTVGQFDIYQITAETGAVNVTFTKGDANSIEWGTAQVNTLTWDNNEKVVWEGESETASIYNHAKKPSNADPLDNLMWNENKEAILIRVYVRAKETEDSLNVVYIDEKFNDTLYSYNIHVKEGVDFEENMVGTPGNMGNRIDVTGCGIVNNYSQTQMFQTDLTQVPEAKGKYNSKLYKYTGSEISEDGKTLYLYYNIDTGVLKTNFVVDFGLPITFKLSDVVTTPDLVEEVTVSARYGDIQYADRTFTYTPTKIMQNIDVISIGIKFDGEAEVETLNAGVTPATTVHYEESYINWGDGWTGGNESITVGHQTTESIGSRKAHNYGYDPIYANNLGASNGTNATTSKIGAKGTFTFKGDGIQIFANGTPETGYIAVEVKNSAGAIVNMSMVNTVVKAGSTGATTGQGGNMYGLPIVSLVDLQNLAHDTYTVTFTKVMDSKPVYIDGIRVFNTLEDSTVFKDDLEDNPDFYEMRDAVLHALGVANNTSVDYKTMYEQVYNAAKGSSALITDESVDYPESATLQDLLDKGPKNEVYLYQGNTLTFKVTTNRVMQLGMKAPRTATTAEITINGGIATEQAIGSSLDMFYSLAGKAANETTYTVQIKNTGSDILSITNLKICDDPNFKFVPLDESDIKDILADAGHVDPDATPEPTETEVCKVFADVEHGAWYEDSVQYVYNEGIIVGDGNVFAPNDDTTRAMVAVILYRLADSPKVTDYRRYNLFKDLPAVEDDVWYTDAVAWALNEGVSTGDDYNMLYNPTAPVTREQLALFLYRYAEYKGENVTVTATEEELFGGAYVNEWAKEGFAWAVENSIIKGAETTDAAGTTCYDLNPQGGATRAQFATMLHRYLGGATE